MLGQSFGGFTLDDLPVDRARGPARGVHHGRPVAGRAPVDDVYAATYGRLIERTARYYARYPDDRARVREIHRRLEAEDVRSRRASG